MSGRRFVIVLTAFVCGACYRVESTPERLTIGFSTLSEAIALAVPLVPFVFSAAVALFLFTRSKWEWKIAGLVVLAVGLTILGCGGLVSPAILQDEVQVTSTGCWQVTGFWFAPNRKGFDYEGVRGVHVYGPDLWIVHFENDRELRLDPGDVWAENAQVIAERLRTHGVPVFFERP